MSSAVFGLTTELPLRTRDTVALETPANLAMSATLRSLEFNVAFVYSVLSE
jgi:hypothetical protein